MALPQSHSDPAGTNTNQCRVELENRMSSSFCIGLGVTLPTPSPVTGVHTDPQQEYFKALAAFL